MSLESWAIDKLSVFLGFDPETLQSQILPYLLTSDSPDAFAEQLMDMVGTSDEALSFIQEFTQRRFGPKQAPEQSQTYLKPKPKPKPKPSAAVSLAKASASSSPLTSSIPDAQLEGSFPSLPSNQQPYETAWPANISVHQKKEDEYFAGLRKNKRSKNKNNELRAAAFPPESKPASAAPKKEKKPNKKEMTLEAALKELDIKTEKPGKKRKPCQCQATKHPLLTAAPNCLSCGKIICTAEGVGPCSFCGSPVLSKDQQIALIAEAKKKRADQKQTQNQPSKRAARSDQAGVKPAYASRLGDGVSIDSFNSTPYQSSDDDDSRLKAERHKEKLLEFQRTSAQRSTVIDQATDFELPTDQANPWLTPQERALMIKRQQSNLKRIEKKGTSNRHKVMTIDVQTRQVRVQDADSSSSSSDDDDTEKKPVTKMDLSKKETAADDGSVGTYAYNPLLKGIEAPKFVGKSTKKTRGQLRRKERVQYDVDDIMNDYVLASSVNYDDAIDPVNEPITCG
ncbi:putative zinc finger motif, C2HC5-type-domain-containing protein [Parasitella parasitica]|nr:putative zinc finger motif, C2HC5-type-domain-containing protein [Parasitella parasitica]